MIFSCKRSNKKRNNKAGTTPALETTSDEKRTVTIGRWNRLYYGFQHFDPTESPKQETKKKTIVVTPQDMDMIDYCYHKVIASKDHEIEILKKTNEGLLRDHECKDTEMDILKQKYRKFRHAALKQQDQFEAEARYREREWAIEKQQLLQEIDWALRGSVPKDDNDTVSVDDSSVDRKESFTRKEMLSKSPTSVRDLIKEREAQISKHS